MSNFIIITIFLVIEIVLFLLIIDGAKTLQSLSNSFKERIEENYKGGSFNIDLFSESEHIIKLFNSKTKYFNGEYVLTTRPENIISSSNVLNEHHTNFIKISNYPQQCMGFGILGTFLGLTIGLFTLRGEFIDSDLLLQKVEGLIGGMSLAFATSLIGMTFSIVGSFIINNTKTKVRNDFKTLNAHIYDRIRVIDPLEYLFSIEQAEKGSDEVVNFRAIDFLSSNLEANQSTATATVAMNNDLATSISSSITENISPTLESLNESIDGFVSDNKNGAQDAISKIITNLEQSMKDMVGQFKNMISEDTKNELEAMASMLSESGEYFVKIPEVLRSILTQIEDQQNQQRDHYQQINTNLDDSLSNFNGEVDRYNDSIQRFDAVQQQFSSSLYQYDQYIRNEQETFRSIDSSFSKFNSIMEQTQNLMGEINSLGGDLGSIFQTLHSNVNQYEREVGSSLNTYLDGYSKAIDEFTYRMETAVNGLQSILDDINDQDRLKV